LKSCGASRKMGAAEPVEKSVAALARESPHWSLVSAVCEQVIGDDAARLWL